MVLVHLNAEEKRLISTKYSTGPPLYAIIKKAVYTPIPKAKNDNLYITAAIRQAKKIVGL